MRYLLFVVLPLVVIGCASSNYLCYKDKRYYHGGSPAKKTVYMFPVSSVKYDEATYGKDSLISKEAVARNDSLLAFFNRAYFECAAKCNRFRASVVDSPDPRKCRIRNNAGFFREKVFDKRHTREIEVALPGKTLLDSLGIRSNYVFHFSDLTIFNTVPTNNAVQVLIPETSLLMSDAFGISWEEPAFELRGKYALWDNDSGRIICAGEFARELKATKLTGERIKDDFFEIIAGILNRTPYWAIVESEEYGRATYYR